MKLIVVAVIFTLNVFGAEWLDNYQTALERSRDEGKPVLVIVMRQSCPWCQKLITETLKNSAINAKIEGNFIPLMLDTEENPREVERSRLRSDSVPASYVLDANGAILNRHIGYTREMEYMRFLQN